MYASSTSIARSCHAASAIVTTTTATTSAAMRRMSAPLLGHLLRRSAAVLQRRLGRRDARDRQSEGRAGDVVEARGVEELDRRGVAAVFAADADLQVGTRLAAAFGRHRHELADAGGVE